MIDAKAVKKFIKRVVAQHDNGSPFSAMREDEIKQLHEQDRLFVYYEPEDKTKLAGVVVARELDRRLLRRDFTQRQHVFPEGTVIVSKFFFSERTSRDELTRILQAISEHFKHKMLAVEIYAEDFRSVNVLKALGFEKVMTKISAFAEIKVVYTNSYEVACVSLDGADAATLLVLDENYFNDAHTTELVNKLEVVKDWFATHYSIYNKDDKWSGMSLRGFKTNDPSFIEKPQEMSKRWKAENAHLLDNICTPTAAADHFRELLIALGMSLGRLERVRFLKLDHRGTIMRHCDIQDKEAGTADDKIVRLHVPLVTNDGVWFTSWDADGRQIRMQMPKNALCYLDHRKPHSVQNDGDARIHLVVDVYSDDKLRDRIRRAYDRTTVGKQIV